MTNALAAFLVFLTAPSVLMAAERQCWPSGHDRLWAQRAAGTDLAQAFLEQKKIPRVTKIGIVDSGFDRSLISKIQQPNSLKIVPLNPSAQGDAADSVGHGTIVLGLIKGANGLGSSTSSAVTLYAVGMERIDVKDVAGATLRACQEGANIISVSIGSNDGMASYIQIPQSAMFGDDVVRELNQRGCVLVHSAGNEAARVRLKNHDFEFEIGAVGPLSQLAPFSSPGEFLMPGQRVTSLRSTSQSPGSGDVSCGDPSSKEALASGTSFSAPLFTGHLALLRDVLMTSPAFQAMGQAQQTKLLREITQASQVGETVNSYLAVRIAFEWTQSPNTSVASAKDRLSGECQSLNSSLTPRARALICEDSRSRLRLASQLESYGDLEGASYWLNTVGGNSKSVQLDPRFPIDKFKADAAHGINLPLVARWVNYYLFRQRFSQVDDAVRLELSTVSAKALSNFSEIIPSLRSPDFSREFQTLTLFVLKNQRDEKFLSGLVEALRVDRYSESALISLFLIGSVEKTITGSDIVRLLETLIGSSHTADDMRSSIALLKYAKVDYHTKAFYLNKLLASSEVPREVFKELSLIGLETDTPSALEIQRWMITLKTLLSSKHCGPSEADDLTIALFAATDDFLKAKRSDADEVLNILDQKLPTDGSSKGRTIVSWVKGQMPK